MEAVRAGNIFSEIPQGLLEEYFEDIVKAKDVRIERIVSQGHISSEDFWYDQAWNEWVLLIKGSAGLRFEENRDPLIMGPGDWVDIPAHCRHRVEWTDPEEKTIWLAIHY